MRRPALFLLVGLVGGCAAAGSARRSETLPAERASELEALERTIEEETTALRAIEPAACADRCRSVDAICEASARICAITTELGEGELAFRCTRAEDRCGAARGATDGSCACRAPPGTEG
jgi:hypothetical protein